MSRRLPGGSGTMPPGFKWPPVEERSSVRFSPNMPQSKSLSEYYRKAGTFFRKVRALGTRMRGPKDFFHHSPRARTRRKRVPAIIKTGSKIDPGGTSDTRRCASVGAGFSILLLDLLPHLNTYGAASTFRRMRTALWPCRDCARSAHAIPASPRLGRRGIKEDS